MPGSTALDGSPYSQISVGTPLVSMPPTPFAGSISPTYATGEAGLVSSPNAMHAAFGPFGGFHMPQAPSFHMPQASLPNDAMCVGQQGQQTFFEQFQGQNAAGMDQGQMNGMCSQGPPMQFCLQGQL